MEEIVIFWFRRDLRLEDNSGLWHSLTSGYKVMPLFIFDSNILSSLEPDDIRMGFLGRILEELHLSIKKRGSSLQVYTGTPVDIFRDLILKYRIKALYFNRDYEPYAVQRDREITDFLANHGIQCFTYQDQVIFEKSEVVKSDGKPYTVYTPYSVKWLSLFKPEMIRGYSSERLSGNFAFIHEETFFMPAQLGFTTPAVEIKLPLLENAHIAGYNKLRDYPSKAGTSLLGPHLRFGTISIREVLRQTWGISEVFVKELIWREFFMQILYHFPFVTERSFRPQFDRIEWVNDEAKFELWCEGRTGFPIIDAGMRELKQTGYMHNRVRMIAANFLTRHLLTDWRWGEAWFAEKLLDFDLASNNGNWQWAAGSGCDAAQYFRIFNPDTQLKKFDPHFEYIKMWIPEIDTPDYPQKSVDLSQMRERALSVYKAGINS
jgi:deoxyribodipyrimidine photo-lyase